MNSPSNDDQVELLDIDDSDLQLTPSLPPLNTQVHVDTSTTQNVDVANLEEIKHVKIILGPAGIIQAAKLRKQSDIQEGGVESVLSTQEYIKKIVEDVGVDEDFNRGPWLSAIDGCLGDIKRNLNKGKLKQVIAIVKSCTPNVLGDLTVTLKDLSALSLRAFSFAAFAFASLASNSLKLCLCMLELCSQNLRTWSSKVSSCAFTLGFHAIVGCW
ncbi:hypothetical protein CTI12_AA162060 [Artemisia annua]|uniref:Uncharacterized protein n=1 Tax=Artemisia annua TaxID=35608 RepID=A0A2U1PEK5_ARTAN|nr:hypothetical protein CTI12_AA162060 [Artemisia annua]